MSIRATTDIADSRRHAPHHFDIAPSLHGLWRVQDREGLIGGIFRTQKDAVRFALFEADWDSACIHLRSAGGPPAGASRSKKRR
jgi:hypothetical protein